MAIIYLAGPIDYGTNDSDERSDFVRVLSEHSVIYDATKTFNAPSVNAMTRKDKAGAISIHHTALEAADIFVADMRKRSVGIPIEMWIAHEHQIPIIIVYDRSLPDSIYIDHVATHFVYDWQEASDLIIKQMLYHGFYHD